MRRWNLNFSFKNYSNDGLRKFADSVIAGNTSGHAENSSDIINNKDRNFSIDSANTIDNYHLFASNIGWDQDQIFPIVSSEPDEFSIFETIPREILTYSQQSGVFDRTIFFQLQN